MKLISRSRRDLLVRLALTLSLAGATALYLAIGTLAQDTPTESGIARGAMRTAL